MLRRRLGVIRCVPPRYLTFSPPDIDCVQTILDCSEANEGFYVKCGFKRAGLEMAHYYEAPKPSV
jgi:glucosamine-phosphate N-acetyltransferase